MAASTDFLLKTACDPDTTPTPEESLIGGPLEENVAQCGLANPITYVDSQDPPFRIFHGEADETVPHCESAALYAALKLARVLVECTLVPGAGHSDLATSGIATDIVAFFLGTLGP
jgi:dipeptidyl aminopeptidase/acylaminoacyl peptidase